MRPNAIMMVRYTLPNGQERIARITSLSQRLTADLSVALTSATDIKGLTNFGGIVTQDGGLITLKDVPSGTPGTPGTWYEPHVAAQYPTIGRVVHFVLKDGQHRKADVVQVGNDDRVNLYVALDGHNDTYAAQLWKANEMKPVVTWPIAPGFLHAEMVPYDETFQRPGTWHWPEKADLAFPLIALAYELKKEGEA